MNIIIKSITLKHSFSKDLYEFDLELIKEKRLNQLSDSSLYLGALLAGGAEKANALFSGYIVYSITLKDCTSTRLNIYTVYPYEFTKVNSYNDPNTAFICTLIVGALLAEGLKGISSIRDIQFQTKYLE